jgi:hypothetical protein
VLKVNGRLLDAALVEEVLTTQVRQFARVRH